jgi:hypothetical protein
VTAAAAVQSGTAITSGADNRGWFTGLFLPPEAGLRLAPVELKWSSVAAGWVRGWSDPAHQTSLALLVSDGALRFEFDDGSAATLRVPGDYVLWAPGLRHEVHADAASTVLTVRWPAVEGWGSP